MAKEKKPENMTTTAILDELHELDDKDDDRSYLLNEEVNKREPFSWIEERLVGSEDFVTNDKGMGDALQEVFDRLEALENKFKRHSHQDGDVVIKYET